MRYLEAGINSEYEGEITEFSLDNTGHACP